MDFPKECFYSKEHTWLKLSQDFNESRTGLVGITDFAQNELGEIVYVDLPNRESIFKQNEVFGSVEAIKTVSDLFMPVSAKVLEVNKSLLQAPTLVNSDPFNGGWMIKIQVENIEEIENLMDSESYKNMVNL